MSKMIGIGSLIGIFFGVLSYFLFPGLLNLDVQFNKLTNEQLGFGTFYYSATGGSILAVGIMMPIFLGITGALVGVVIPKMKKINAFKLFLKICI